MVPETFNGINEFVEYVWEFYAPGKLYGEFFNDKLTKPLLRAAVELRARHKAFCGDSVDREAVRDILILALGQEKAAL